MVKKATQEFRCFSSSSVCSSRLAEMPSSVGEVVLELGSNYEVVKRDMTAGSASQRFLFLCVVFKHGRGNMWRALRSIEWSPTCTY